MCTFAKHIHIVSIVILLIIQFFYANCTFLLVFTKALPVQDFNFLIHNILKIVFIFHDILKHCLFCPITNIFFNLLFFFICLALSLSSRQQIDAFKQLRINCCFIIFLFGYFLNLLTWIFVPLPDFFHFHFVVLF